MRSWRLSTSLIFLMVATTVSTFIVLGASLLVYRLPLVAENSRETARREASDIENLVDFNLNGIEAQLRPTVAFLRKRYSEAELQAHLDAIVGDGVVMQALYVVDGNGAVEAVGLPPPRQERRADLKIGDYSANPLFHTARDTAKIAWSDKYLSAMTGSFAVGVAIPADDRVVIGEISPDAIVDTVRTIARRTDNPVLVVDSRGEWIADNSSGGDMRLTNWGGQPAVRAALTGVAAPEIVEFAGVPHHPGYATSPTLGWAFVVGVPAGTNNPEIRTTLYLVIGSFFAALCVGALIAPLWATQMARPLRHLMERTNRLARGDFSTTSIEPGRIFELNQLAADMETMAAAIHEREDEVAMFARHLKESEHELENIFNASPAAMSVSDVNHDYAIIAVNEAWEKQFGRSRNDVIGLTEAEAGIWSFAADRDRFIAKIEGAGSADGFEVWMRRSDGTQLLCNTAGRVVDSGEQRLLIMVQEDYTERRRIEQEIRDLNADLETRVQRRTEDLARANRELGETLANLTVARDELVRAENLAALGRLVAGVAHELNTPIGNGLMAATTLRDQLRDFRRSLADGLRRNAFDAFLEGTDTASDIIVRNLERGAHLVNSFKRLAVDQTSAQRRQFALSETIGETLTIIRPTIKRTPYVIETAVPDDIELDSFPGALEQVLTNLVNNAVIHGFDGRDHGRISIKAELTDERHVRITVADDGKGVPLKMQAHIFEPFFTTKLGQGGSGLGLHITHNAVAGILGGTIEFDSTEGEGTRFTIVLPLVAPATENVVQPL